MSQETVWRQVKGYGLPVKLFACAQALPSKLNREALIQTPRGTIRVDAMIEGAPITRMPPTSIYSLPDGGFIHSWHQANLVAELLLARPRFEAMYDGSEKPGLVADCWAGVWRIRADRRLGEIVFIGLWDHGVPTGLTGGPASGQGLAAQSWHDAEVSIALGTVDDEQPPRVVTYLDDGFRVSFEETARGEHRQTQFLVAWGPYDLENAGTEMENADTWFAVDLPPNTLLRSIGCSIRPS